MKASLISYRKATLSHSLRVSFTTENSSSKHSFLLQWQPRFHYPHLSKTLQLSWKDFWMPPPASQRKILDGHTNFCISWMEMFTFVNRTRIVRADLTGLRWSVQCYLTWCTVPCDESWYWHAETALRVNQ